MSRKIKAKFPIPKKENRLLIVAASVTKESKEIDFKQGFDINSAQECCEIIKDIMAMANSGGGIIMFGIDDNGAIVNGFNTESILSIDPATISDKIQAYTGEDFSDFQIVEVIRHGQTIPSFLVGESLSPIPFTRPGADITQGGKQRPAFVKGSTYFRHGAKSEPANANDFRRAIDRAINRTKRKWFEGVRKISNIKTGNEVVITKSKNAAQIFKAVPGRIVADKKAATFRPDNAQDLWPHRSKELLKKVNELLPDDQKINSHDFLAFKKMFKLDHENNPDFIYKPYKDISPRYSDAFVERIVDAYKKNPQVFEDAKASYKEAQERKKSKRKT